MIESELENFKRILPLWNSFDSPGRTIDGQMSFVAGDFGKCSSPICQALLRPFETRSTHQEELLTCDPRTHGAGLEGCGRDVEVWKDVEVISRIKIYQVRTERRLH